MRLWRFFRHYPQLGLVIISIVIALPLDLFGYDKVAHIILIISATANLIPLVWGMIQDLRAGQYGVDILAATAIATSLLMREYWAGIVIVLMLTGGESLEDYAQNRAQTELNALLARSPKKAHVLRGRKTLDIPVHDIQVGDKLLVKPGEVVPVDATILEGTSSLDESSLTGESLPVAKKVGDEVLSGSVAIDGALTIRAAKIAEDSQFEQIIKLVKAAASSKSPMVRLADRYSIPFTIISFAIAIGAWILSGESLRFLQVLVVATPCPLILGAPIALISGMSRSAKHGIIVKSGAALERLAAVRTIGFDKTGTLTVGKPKVGQVKTYNGFKKDEVLGLAASLEQNSTHVLAHAVIDAARAQNIKITKAKHIQEVAGYGLRARIKNREILVGRLSLLKEHGVTIPQQTDSRLGKTGAYVAVDGKLAGIISFEDELRNEAASTLQRLKQLGIRHFLMVTGDNKATAQAIAKKLGIQQVVAEALPADKMKAIETVEIKPVGFVGDGVNDAPVLAASDVGIALGARGSTAASESADVVIMLDDISYVSIGLAIAKRTIYIAKQSILIGIIISIGLMLVFATGRFKPVYGALLQEVVDIIVIFNALRAHGSWRKDTIKLSPAVATTTAQQ